MKLLFRSRTISIPCQAVTRFGVLWLQSEKARVLWQKLQLTPRESAKCIISE